MYRVLFLGAPDGPFWRELPGDSPEVTMAAGRRYRRTRLTVTGPDGRAGHRDVYALDDSRVAPIVPQLAQQALLAMFIWGEVNP